MTAPVWAVWPVLALAAFGASALTALGAAAAITRRTPAPGHPRVPAPTPVPGGTGPVKSAAGTPSRQPPAPGTGDLHGGIVTTIDIHKCGRMTITDWDRGEAEIHHGECETCTGTRCYLCGFYLKYDPGRGQWVPRYERCPAHEGQEVPGEH